MKKSVLKFLLASVIIAILSTTTIYATVTDIQTISSSHTHTMAIKKDGSLWAWGSNWNGQFGNGYEGYSLLPQKITDGVISVSVGNDYSMFIKEDGSLWGCGYNGFGQLGDGTEFSRYSPVKIMDDVYKVISKNDVRNPSITMAIKDDGSLWIWGVDGMDSFEYPNKIMDDVIDVQIGDAFYLILKSDGGLWSFGLNDYGQIGNGTTETASEPIKIMDKVKRIAAGEYSSYAIKEDNSLWVWGYGHYGQLGDGHVGKQEDHIDKMRNPNPKKVMDNIVDISAGYRHALALKNDGSLYAFGNNEYGQIGIGKESYISSSQKIMNDVIAIKAGILNSMAIKSDNSLWTWGANNFGQIGNGSKTNVLSPIKILDDIMVSSVRIKTIKTTNISTIKLTNWKEFDGGPAIYYDIKNEVKPKKNERILDTNRYALVYYANNKWAEIHFLGTNEIYNGESLSGYFTTLYSGPSYNTLKGIVVSFENDEEIIKFKENIPYQDYGERYDFVIDEGPEGEKWFKNTFNIDINFGQGGK